MTAELEFVPVEKTFRGDGWSVSAAMQPAIHVEEFVARPGEPIPPSPPPAGVSERPVERYRHRTRHLAPPRQTPQGFFTREQPRPVSRTFGDVGRDWDFVVQHRDKVLAGAGVTAASSDRDKVHALAEDIWKFRRQIRQPGVDLRTEEPWSHPADTLCYGSWCVGAGNAMVALCNTLRIPARLVGVNDHTMSEVWLDGAWRFVENAGTWLEGGGECLQERNWAQVIADPHGGGPGITDAQRYRYQVMWQGGYEFPQPDGLFAFEGGFQGAHLTPQTAASLYAGWDEPVFKSAHGDRYDLVWGWPAANCLHDEWILRQGGAFGRRFWLGSLGDTRRVLATFCGPHNQPEMTTPPHRVASDGGEWFVQVNDRRHAVGDQGGWTFLKDGYRDRSVWIHEFEIPLGELRESAWNTIALGNAGRGPEFLHFGGGCEPLAPAEPCWCRNVPG